MSFLVLCFSVCISLFSVSVSNACGWFISFNNHIMKIKYQYHWGDDTFWYRDTRKYRDTYEMTYIIFVHSLVHS